MARTEFGRAQVFFGFCLIFRMLCFSVFLYRVILQSSAQSYKSVKSQSPSDNEEVRKRTRTSLSSSRESRWVFAWWPKCFCSAAFHYFDVLKLRQSHIVQIIFSLPFHSLLLHSRLARSLGNLPVMANEKKYELCDVNSVATDRMSKKSNKKHIIPISSEPLGPSISQLSHLFTSWVPA